MVILPEKKCFKDPSQLLKFVILFVCAIFTFTQVTQCVKKFIHPPAATHSEYTLNNSIRYPCLTICRRPAFKSELFRRFGIETLTLVASFAFRNFNFSRHTLTELMENTTYSYDEIFYQYGYASKGSSHTLNTSTLTVNTILRITKFFYITRGRCFTFQPLIMSQIFSVSGGFMFFLKHNVTNQAVNELGISTHGYEIYLHDPNEMLTYGDYERGNFMEYIDLEASEDMRVKFEIQEFGRTPTKDNKCISDGNYSKSKCEEECINKQIATMVNCTVPWFLLPEGESFLECSDYMSVRTAMRSYVNFTARKIFLENCNCPIACNFTMYKTSIINRRNMEPILAPNCLISIYCTNLIYRMSEIFGYDSNQLLADIGGSLGFLLGLSVISLICLIEEISKLLFRLFFKRKSQKEQRANEEIESNNDQSAEKIKEEESKTIQKSKEMANLEMEHSYTNIDFVANYKDFCIKNFSDHNSNHDNNTILQK